MSTFPIQNLRAVVSGVTPASLLPGQLAFNTIDKLIFVGDGSNFKTDFTGAQTPGVPQNGWYSMPMDFTNLNNYYVPDPSYWGDFPLDQQVLGWDTQLGHPVWVSNGSPDLYVFSNATVAAAPGGTLNNKLNGLIGGSQVVTGAVTIVTGLPGEQYQGLYFYTTEWTYGASYAFPTAAQVPYDNNTSGLAATDVQLAVDEVNDTAVAALPRAGGTMTGPLTLDSTLVDGLGSPGAPGYLLQSTATGVEWVADSPGDTTLVSGTAPIVVDNTDPQLPVVSIDAATTLTPGAVQLTDSVSSTSTTTAATPNSVKTAYDLAAVAVPDTSYTAAGDLLVGTGSGTYTALPAGATDYILASNGAGVLTWVAQSEGDVTGVTGTAPVTVDNTDPQKPVIGINLASTLQPGAVQLTDSVSSTSTSTAATPHSVKSAYDLASLALPLTGGTLTGTLYAQNICLGTGYNITFNGGAGGSIKGISDAIANTNNDIAASSTAVKDVYVIADAALPKAGGTMTGSISFVNGQLVDAGTF